MTSPSLPVLPASMDQSSIVRRNQRESPFLRLPGEVRNKIYEYALGGREICYWSESRWPDFGFYLYPYSQGSLVTPNLFKLFAPLHMVCRQTWRETHGMPFSLNTFVLVHCEDSEKLFARYVAQLCLFNSVRIQVNIADAIIFSAHAVLGHDLEHRFLLLDQLKDLKHVAVSFGRLVQYAKETLLQDLMAGVKKVFDSSKIAESTTYTVLDEDEH